ncbi:NAD(P)-dependent dehydrogenase (short-subunit alcohol dehydrogenase family) [Rhizobium mesoamericanum]|uniref:SDR family NAD(P)-dependent oxidoreductase n=1 Tax=Rhizobium mesoamericanum TaxID=1079800 RepID=UPI00278249DD|nr:SDR family oxidoreductase [Rhizobium mesoamericanum]MDQ0562964.1 NAD(P)-dependent dehydrogenase (short-subunit alcohol dehydrogenase family) [Rhizobium mesoamericanum]
MAFNPTILITGAASGIGAALARCVAAPGVQLILHTGRNLDALQSVAEEARTKGAEVMVELGDLTDPTVAPRLVGAARTAFGKLDQIVSNAGRAKLATFENLSEEDLIQAIATMPFAFFRLAKEALPDLRRSPQGRVVVVSSFVAHSFGTNDMHFTASSAAKAALEALAKSLAAQTAADGVTVNCIVPGFVRKDTSGHAATSVAAMERARAITPNGRLGEPQDVAELIAFLLSQSAKQITGQTMHVDGGLLLP